MILRKSVFLSVALLLLAILVLPPGTSSASISTPRSSEATPSLPADRMRCDPIYRRIRSSSSTRYLPRWEEP